MEVRESIGIKIRRVVLITTLIVVGLTVSSFVIYEIFSFRKSHLENTSTLAHIIADNLTAALAFQDPAEGDRVLRTLRAEPTVRLAVVYDTKGHVFAVYPKSVNTNSLPALPVETAAFYAKGKLIVVQPSIQDRRVGTLYLEADLAPLYDRLRLYLGIVIIIIAGSFVLAYFLSSSLQKRISRPVLSLAATARHISEKRDYSVRVQKMSDDEIGALTTAFNHMLTQIGERDSALSQSAERLRMALEASQTGTWNWDLTTGLVSWDEFLHRIYGLKPGEFSGVMEHAMGLIHPEDRAGVEWATKRALEKGREFVIDYRIIRPDGTIHYLSSRGKAFLDEQGKPMRMAGVTLDVTESKAAEQALRESEERFRAMADAAPVFIWTGAPEKGRDYFNRPWLEFTGRRLEQELGEGWKENIHPEDRKATLESYDAAVRAQRPFRIEYRLQRQDGEYRWIVDHGVPRFARDGAFRGYIGSCVDITERKLAQAELEQRVQERTAELAETNKELEAFTYSVSHDLRSPLRHINAYAQILEEEFTPSLSEEAQRYVARIRQGAKNMGNLVDDLLNLARVGRQELAHQPSELNAMVSEIVSEMRAETEGRDIEWKIGHLSESECDPGLIKQVFTNLIANAVKYSRPRKHAIIEIGEEWRDGERVIYVRDNGVGFSMKYAHKLFGVFQRLHRPDEFEGTGVGLATVDRIVRKHKGRIWAEAELDKGATFYFTLPALEKREQESRATENAAA